MLRRADALRVPAYRWHRPIGQAVVTFPDGRQAVGRKPHPGFALAQGAGGSFAASPRGRAGRIGPDHDKPIFSTAPAGHAYLGPNRDLRRLPPSSPAYRDGSAGEQ